MKMTEDTDETAQPRSMTEWTQERISRWTLETFGEPRSNLAIAVRANEEMAELLRALSLDDWSPYAREEVADVVITLCRLVTRLEGDMARDINEKMERNLLRRWSIDSNGLGDHI